jgi:RNase adapter protein RapZ
MRLLIITGLSGSGKTSVLHALEDTGFFCVDSLPVEMLPGLVDYLNRPQGLTEGLAVGIDMREGHFLEAYARVFTTLRSRGIQPEIFFLETATQVLIRRFEETRRRHPLAEARTLLEGIEWERAQLSGLRQVADKVIDTSSFNIHQLRNYIQVLCGRSGQREQKLKVEIISFSYAKGLPLQADLIMDVRFLPNPHYETALKDRDGRDPEVQRYIRSEPKADEILETFFQLIEGVVALYENEDRAYFVLAIGCTGGRHRSVAVVCSLEERLRLLGYSPKVLHRDIQPESEPACSVRARSVR